MKKNDLSTCEELGIRPDPELDCHQIGHLDPDPDRHQNDVDPQQIIMIFGHTYFLNMVLHRWIHLYINQIV